MIIFEFRILIFDFWNGCADRSSFGKASQTNKSKI